MMWWNDNNVTWANWAAMSLGMLVVWGVVLTGLYLLLRASTGGWTSGPNARAILDRRLARGEIDTVEYSARLRALDE